MLIEINTTWTATGNGAGGKTATGTGTAFDTVTHTVVPFNESINQSILDPVPPNVHRQPGDVLHVECDADYTATVWRYVGGTFVSYDTVPQSTTYCGWTPPQTGGPACQLGTATLSQGATPAGPTLTAAIDGAVAGTLRYALDNGAEQLSATFAVTPGPHTVRIRDTGVAGCTRSVTAVVSDAPLLVVPAGAPQGVDFVLQPLWFAPAGVPGGADVEVELWAESAQGREDYARVLTLRKRADAQGRAAFRLDGLLAPRLQAFVPPAVPTTTLRCPATVLNYFVRTVAYVAGQLPVYATGPLRTALRGGLPAERRDLDYFAYRLDAFGQPPFLTWQPAGKRITVAQPEWLFWLCPPGTPTRLVVRRSYVRTGFAEAAPVVEDEAVVLPGTRGAAGQLLAIPVKPRPDTDSVSVALYNDQDEALSPLVGYPMVPATPRSRYLVFSNSLGGLDTLRTEGRLESVLEGAADSVERPAGPGDASPAADRQTFAVAGSRKLKLATGWLTAAQLRWLQELVLARDIWEAQGARLLPLDWPKRQLAYQSDEAPLRGVLLDFDYAFAPTAYADLP